MTEQTRAQKYAAADQDAEIGATSGTSHADLLMRQLGHDEGLSLATGVSYQKPLVVGEDERRPHGRSSEPSRTRHSSSSGHDGGGDEREAPREGGVDEKA